MVTFRPPPLPEINNGKMAPFGVLAVSSSASSGTFLLIQFFTDRWIFLQFNSKEMYLSSKEEKSFLCSPPAQNMKFGSFKLQSCNDGKEMYKKVWCTNKVVVLFPWGHSLIWPKRVWAAEQGMVLIQALVSYTGYTISPLNVLNKVSFWTGTFWS